MAHTQLELMLDEFVGQHLTARLVIHTKDSMTGEWRLLSGNENLNDDTPYRMWISAYNDSTETSARNVQIHVTLPRATKRILYYSDDTYRKEIKEKTGKVYPEILGPGESGLFNALCFEVSPKCHGGRERHRDGKIWDSHRGFCLNLWRATEEEDGCHGKSFCALA